MTVHFEDLQGESQVPRFWAVLEFTNGDLFYVWARSCPTLCNPLDCSPLPALCCLTGCQLWAVCTQSCIQQIIVCAQSCVTLCNPMDCSPPGASVWNSSRQEYWSGLPFPTPGDLPDPGIKPASPSNLLHCRQILYHWTTRGGGEELISSEPTVFLGGQVSPYLSISLPT